MSLITGHEWEAAVGRYLGELPGGWVASKQQPPGNHRGRGVRFSEAGPADFALLRGGVRVVVEVKAHTEQAHTRWPLRKLKRSQAEDLDRATHGAVLLRFAGHGDDELQIPSRLAPDLVFTLDWANLGPVWWTATRTGNGHGLSPRDCLMLAHDGGVRLVQDPHGQWTCPDVMPALFRAWGLG